MTIGVLSPPATYTVPSSAMQARCQKESFLVASKLTSLYTAANVCMGAGVMAQQFKVFLLLRAWVWSQLYDGTIHNFSSRGFNIISRCQNMITRHANAEHKHVGKTLIYVNLKQLKNTVLASVIRT